MKYMIDFIDKTEIDFSNLPINNLENFFTTRNAIFDFISRFYYIEFMFRLTPLASYHTGGLPYIKKEAMINVDEDLSIFIIEIHKFSIMITNYLRTVGMLKYLLNENLNLEDLVHKTKKISAMKIYINKFLNENIKDVVTWRNKVSAHFSVSDPKVHDDILTLENSMSASIVYLKPRIYVSGITSDYRAKTIDFGKFINPQDKIPLWSPTKVYERLTKRFWPNNDLLKEKFYMYNFEGIFIELKSNIDCLNVLWNTYEKENCIILDIYSKLHVLLERHNGLLWKTIELFNVNTKIAINGDEVEFSDYLSDFRLCNYIHNHSGTIDFYRLLKIIIKQGNIIFPIYIHKTFEGKICYNLKTNKNLNLKILSTIVESVNLLYQRIEKEFIKLSRVEKDKKVEFLLPPKLRLYQ